MGDILVNMGRFAGGFMPAFRQALPHERLRVWPDDGPGDDPEILATLSIAGESEGPVAEALRLPGLRWVHVLGAGIDGFPLDRLGDRTLTCAKGATSVPIAEYVLAVILAFAKRLPEEWLAGPPAAWNAPQHGALGLLAGRTLGLVGVGAIGTEVARRALAFDMQVVATRRSAAPMPIEGIEAASFEEVLARSDHLVVCAPNTPDTHHLLGTGAFARVKSGVHVVNVARGSLIDNDALLAALDEGRVARASLDVADGEPLPAGHPLYGHPNVRLTPHLSHSSTDATGRTIDAFTANLARWRRGEPLQGVVDPAVGY